MNPEYFDDDFSVNGNGFKNGGGKGARGGGKRTKKAAQENKERIYNSKTARHKASLMSQVGSNLEKNTGLKNKGKGKSKGKAKGKK